MINQRILDSIGEIEQISNKLLKIKEEVKDEELERYSCKFEKARMDMYDAVEQRNLFIKFGGGDAISCIYNAITEYYSDSELQFKIDYGCG